LIFPKDYDRNRLDIGEIINNIEKLRWTLRRKGGVVVMPSPLENESIGDWNNIKGTEYHFVYALWLLLYRKVPSVAFYKGNDLLARPILPPKLQRVSSIVPLRIQQQSPQEDIWIQLKATKTPWTLRELQQGNLLANFLYNALFSENEKSVWRIQLITQAELRTDALNDFIKSPAKHPDFKNHINKIMIDVQQRWQDTFHITVDKSHLKSFMHFILQQLTETYPVPLEVLKAQIETQIAYQRPDPEGVREIGQRLLGALLVATGQGPDKATDYTAEWLEEVTGLPLVSGTLLTNGPVQASIESLKLSLPPTWNPLHFVSRPLVDEALGQFLSSTKTLFVLVGMSGVGKSWMATHWTTQVLKRHICLLFRGSDLYGYRGAGAQELNMLIASRLRSYAPADWSNETILRRVLPTPVTDDFHRHLIIVIDDLRFPSNPEESRIFIQYLVLQSHLGRKGGKLSPRGEVDDHRRTQSTSQSSRRKGTEPDQPGGAGPD
jgi:hypothetical protein